jgi:hypothetical protein
MTRVTKGSALLGVLALLAAACTKSGATGGAEGTGSEGSGVSDGCPKDLLDARGKRCSPDGKTCGTDPSGFTHLLMCSSGKWVEMEAPPPPPPPTAPMPSN